MATAPHRVTMIMGTRPEVIKLAPVVGALDAVGVDTEILVTGQHREMVDQMLAAFALRATHDLDVMTPGQTLDDIVARVVAGVGARLARSEPDLVIVQGDTSSAMAGALAACHHRVPVAHVEAGLRTGDPAHPFPEELNRRVVGQLAALHFAPTARAVRNLLREGVSPASIHQTGNTVVDAARWMAARVTEPVEPTLDRLDPGARLILVTTHRRENLGAPMAEVLKAVAALVDRHPDVHVLFPVHLNPRVQEVAAGLADRDRISLLPPLGYPDLMYVLSRCHLVLTDSGGIQEEAPSFGKPVLVLREQTERPEGVEAGNAFVVGTDAARIEEVAGWLLTDDAAYAAVARVRNPYGDGRAGERIADVVRRHRSA